MKNEENKIVEIDTKQCKRMLVWDEDWHKAQERVVIVKVGDRYLCVENGGEENFLTRKIYGIVTWKYAKPLPETKRLTLKQIAEKFGVDAVEIIEGEG